MATHSSILAWKTPWAEEPGGLQSMGSQKSWTWLSTLTHTHTHTHKDQHILISSSWNSISSSSAISAKAKSPSASHPPLLSCCTAYWKLRYVDLRWGEALLQLKWLKNSVKAAWSWKLNSSIVGPRQGTKNKKKRDNDWKGRNKATNVADGITIHVGKNFFSVYR